MEKGLGGDSKEEERLRGKQFSIENIAPKLSQKFIEHDAVFETVFEKMNVVTKACKEHLRTSKKFRLVIVTMMLRLLSDETIVNNADVLFVCFYLTFDCQFFWIFLLVSLLILILSLPPYWGIYSIHILFDHPSITSNNAAPHKLKAMTDAC